MRRTFAASFAATALLLVGACGGSSSSSPSASSSSSSSSGGTPPGDDAGAVGSADAASDGGPATGDGATPADGSGGGDGGTDKSAGCVATFGTAIGAVGFARFDGTVVAVLAPGNKTCTAPNATHLVVEMTFSGAVYRMVVDVNDQVSAGTIRAHTLNHAMVGGAWSDGWHAVPLDYPGTFGLHDRDFLSESTADAVASVTAALEPGAHVSVFATAQGENDSAHLVHRNLTNQDGAIVVDVDSASPTWLLLSFSDQTF
jgi:hypothetical protein